MTFSNINYNVSLFLLFSINKVWIWKSKVVLYEEWKLPLFSDSIKSYIHLKIVFRIRKELFLCLQVVITERRELSFEMKFSYLRLSTQMRSAYNYKKNWIHFGNNVHYDTSLNEFNDFYKESLAREYETREKSVQQNFVSRRGAEKRITIDTYRVVHSLRRKEKRPRAPQFEAVLLHRCLRKQSDTP